MGKKFCFQFVKIFLNSIVKSGREKHTNFFTKFRVCGVMVASATETSHIFCHFRMKQYKADNMFVSLKETLLITIDQINQSLINTLDTNINLIHQMCISIFYFFQQCAQPQIFLGTKFKFQILKNKKEKKCLNVTAKI